MASIRGEIHINELDRFAVWLAGQGFTIEPTKGYYEKLRARKGSEVMLWYKREGSAHLSSSLERPYIIITENYRRDMRKLKREGNHGKANIKR